MDILKSKLGWFAILGTVAGACALSLTGCGKAQSSDGAGSEIAVSSASGAASSTENAGSVASNTGIEPRTWIADLKSCFISDAFAATACPTVQAATSCSTTAMSMTYSACSFGTSTATWNGSQNIAVAGSGCSITCGLTPFLGLGAGCTITRTFGAGTKRMSASGAEVAIDTSAASGYSSAVSGGTVATCSAGGCGTGRSIQMKGIHLTSAFWDHTVYTDPNDPIVVTGTGTSRTISSGTTIVQHNIAKFLTTTKIASPLVYGTAGCCFPTSGAVTTTFSSDKFKDKSETLTFSSTCGQASLTNTRDETSTMTLTHCL